MKYLNVLLLAILLIGCSNKEVEPLKLRIKALESKTDSLSEDLTSERRFISNMYESIRDIYPSEAVIDPFSRGFSIVNSNNGHFIIACDNLEAFGDGQKVTLRIGNPYAMTYSGFTVTCTYGKRMPEGYWFYKSVLTLKPGDTAALARADSNFVSENIGWEKSLKKKEIKCVENLEPGKWNTVSIVLAPAKAEDVAYLAIKIETDQVRLQRY